MASRGLLVCVLFFVLALGASSGSGAAVGVTFIVNSTADTPDASLLDAACADTTGACTLRAAIQQSNHSTGFKDTIAFGIPGSGPHLIVITPLSSFPNITDAVVIDAKTQPGYLATPVVEINAGGAGPTGLLVIGDGSAGTELRGLAIYGQPSGLTQAITFNNPGGNVVEQNFIGTDTSGTVAKGVGALEFFRVTSGFQPGSSGNTISDNVITGVGGGAVNFITVSDSQVVRNRIGTDASGTVGLAQGFGVGVALQTGSRRNLVANNVIAGLNRGIRVFGDPGLPSDDSRIEGNLIGTDVTGPVDLGNTGVGIDVGGLAPRTIIGGADPAARNVISGNHGGGVFITGNVGDTIVQGNLIGTDRTGALDRGNGGAGVALSQTTGLILIRDNVVSGNDSQGISGGTGVGTVRVEHNRVGTNADGTAAIPNDREGVLISGTVAASVVGGETAAQRNVISGNGGDGVSIGDGVDVFNNYIGTNKDGAGDLGNGEDGVAVSGADAVIGKPGAGNVISNNGGAGVALHVAGTTVQANMIGTDAGGNAGLGNKGAGIFGACCFSNARIGGAATGESNVISGNGGWGIDLGASGQGTHVIQGNRIGTNTAGTAAIGNGAGGVHLHDPDGIFHVVGNLVSGNGGDGLYVESVGLSESRVVGNLIGTDASGMADVGNAGNGARLGRAFVEGTIVVGGATPSDRNVISGNDANGLLVVNAEIEITGNYVGTNVNGAQPIPNALSGLRVQAAPNTVEHNVFSGNGGDGVEIVTSGQQLRANLIGTGADGTLALGNAGHGVSLEGTGFVGNNVVGGTTPADGNTIAFNRKHGVLIHRLHVNRVQRNSIFSNGGDGVAVVAVPPQGAIRNTISENSIYGNDGLGIDLQDDGVTNNDLGDADGGSGFAALANFLQNTPVNLQVSGDGTTVTGTINSRPNTVYRIELFASSAAVACDPSGSGEGEAFLTATNVTTDASGNAAFSVPLPEALLAGQFVTATATDAAGSAFPGNTSEFSQCSTPPGTIIIHKATVPSPDPTDTSFAFTASGGLSPTSFSLKNGESQTFANLAPRAGYSVAEITPGGWTSTSVCSDGSPPSNIELDAGETVTCTFTNTKRSHIVVDKVTNPSNDPQSFSFDASGGDYADFSLTDAATPNSQELPSGKYAVSETVPSGWDLSSATCTSSIGGTETPANIELDAGETVTCTFTNTKRSHIVVDKVTNPSNDPQSFSFKASGGDYADFSLTDAAPPNSQELVKGTYAVSETLSSGWDLTSATCTSSIGDTETPANIELDAGETVTCTFTNTKRSHIVVDKVTNPSNDPESFSFKASGGDYADFSLTDAAAPDSQELPPGKYAVSETVPSGWDLTGATCTSSIGDTETPANIELDAGETVTCTFTNTKRGLARIVKTVRGTPPSGLQSFTFQVRQGASATSAGTILASADATSGNGGVINFATTLVPAVSYALCEIVMPGWMTTLGPPFYVVYNPSGDNSTVCTDFKVDPGETRTFAIDNKPPPGGLARTIGFWKNWAACAGSKGNQKPVLDQTLADADPSGIAIGTLTLHAGDCVKATRLLDKSTVDTGKKMASDPAFSLAAQLLAARLNIVAGAGSCPAAVTAINDGQTLLTAMHFNGITHDKLSAAQATQATTLASTLDRYNNNLLC